MTMNRTNLLALILSVAMTGFVPSARAADDVTKWLQSRYEVKQVSGPDSFVVDFNGIGLSVRLAHVKPRAGIADKATAFMKEKLNGRKVTIVPEEALPVEVGCQAVYAFVEDQGKRLFLNETIVLLGLANHVPGPTAKFQKFVTMIEEAAKSAPPEYRAEGTGYCSELNSRNYHRLDCKWAIQMNSQNRIVYESFAAAEKAGKMPCSSCSFERLKDLRSEQQLAANENEKEKQVLAEKLAGALVGLKTDNYFYSPVSPKLAKAKPDDIIRFASLAEAKNSGRLPDLASLRLDNPVVPPPLEGECIGRGLPYFRPCLRPAVGPTGLCEACLNRRIR